MSLRVAPPTLRPRYRVAVVLLLVAGFAAGFAGTASAAPSTAKPPVVRMPIGSIDVARGSTDGSITVSGWTIDPDTAAPTRVVVVSDGALAVVTADLDRPDVGLVYPFHGSRHGFTSVLAGLSTGPHRVCVLAVNLGAGFPFALLGCRDVLTGPTDPFGSLESLELTSFDQVTASGWAIDPQTWFPLETRLTIDGRVVSRVPAGATRPDVGAVWTAYGPGHGFVVAGPIAPGRHEVCVVAVNIGWGNDSRLGCRTFDVAPVVPFGVFEGAVLDGNRLVVAGWALDPDAPGNSQVRIDIRNSPLVEPLTTVISTGWSRPDVFAAHGISSTAGFSATVGLSDAGALTVCATVINRNVGRDASIGCRAVAVVDRRPVGFLDSVTPVSGGFVATGWAADRDGPGPVSVVVDVDGVRRTVTASGARPDVAAVYPELGGSRGFTLDWTGLSSGFHSVCVTFTDIVGSAPGLGGDRVLPCGAVVVGSTSIGTTGAPVARYPVGPAPGTPLADIDRDGGVSARLRDGSTLWLFGDSSASNADGSLRYFVNNTAAWAAPGQPTLTRDAAAAGAPVPFVLPASPFAPCTHPAARQGMWPMSAVVVADGPTDRVIAYFENLCIGPGQTAESRGVAVVEWRYAPSTPPYATQPSVITGTVLNQQLSATRSFGTAAALGSDGLVYAYSCDGPPGGGFPAEYGPCRVARVAPDEVADPGAYSFWTGTSWSPSSSAAGAMVTPPGPDGQNLPVSSFSVVRDEPHGVYVMAYTPWPGFNDRVVVRVARDPIGPWSPPVEIELPGCRDQPAGAGYYCYAGTAQPQLSSASALGIGYYDQLVALDPLRGQYQTVTVPFVVGLD